MADTTRIQFYLSNEALALVDANAGGVKSKGDWVSTAIIEYARIKGLVGEDETCGTLEQIATRLLRIEQRIAIMDVKIDDLSARP